MRTSRARWRGPLLFMYMTFLFGCSAGENRGENPVQNFSLSVSTVGVGTSKVSSVGGATYCESTCVSNLPEDSVVTLTAMPAADSVFDGWGGDCVGTDPIISVLMTGRKSCITTFNPKSPGAIPPAATELLTGVSVANGTPALHDPQLTLSKSGAGGDRVLSGPEGIDCGSLCQASFEGGQTVMLTAIPSPGSSFIRWRGDCTGSEATISITLSANKSCAAIFTGAFVPVGEFAVRSGPNGVAVGDFNRDGKLDLVSADFSGNTVSILTGKGNGSFDPSASFAASGGSSAYIGAGDFNEDGNLDVAVPNMSDAVSILLGDGEGSFGPATNFGVGIQPYGIAVADLNLDGRPDLAVPNSVSDTVSILLGKGGGIFDLSMNYQVGRVPYTVAVGDFNRDGLPDLAVPNEGENTVSILLGEGQGVFGAATEFDVEAYPRGVAVGDFNQDGDPDLAVTNQRSDTVSILLGDGEGRFQDSLNIRVGISPRGVAVDDFNQDGVLDIATTNQVSNTVSILLGDATGRFPVQYDVAAGFHPRAVATGDFDQDGKVDLAVANRFGNSLSILLSK